jgi:hypothetical protein
MNAWTAKPGLFSARGQIAQFEHLQRKKVLENVRWDMVGSAPGHDDQSEQETGRQNHMLYVLDNAPNAVRSGVGGC